MTQPCHKDTTLNRQCCDREHNNGGRGNARGTRQCKREQNNARRVDPSEHGDTTQHTTPTIQRDHHANERGGNTRTGRPVTPPPFTRHATHHPQWPHPPPRRGGGRTEDTPPHEQHRHVLTTHAPRTRQGIVHDMTAVLASTAVGRVGHEPQHCTGQDCSSTHHRHSTRTRRMDTIHSSTHPLSHCSCSHNR